MPRRSRVAAIALIAVIVLVPLAACGATATPGATVAPTVVATQVAATTAPAASTSTAVPATPTVGPVTGGTLRRALTEEPDTLDVQKSTARAMSAVMSLVGASLLAKDPETGKIVGYLADSWSVSEDGLTWTFKLRPGVKFHDGSSLTAADYAWTINRALDPETKSTGSAHFLSSVASVTAEDDLTLVIQLTTTNYYFLETLTLESYTSPLPRAAVEKAGGAWGRNPIGCGPYKLASWQTGTRIVLERNTDYRWRPAWYKGSGPYIDKIEFRIIPDASTIQAGVESLEIDYAGIQQKDVARTRASGSIDVYGLLAQGSAGYVALNSTRPTLADPAVRQALSCAVDRAPIIQAVYNGEAFAQKGPLSRAMFGYDEVQETYAPDYDVAKAREILADAGYTPGADEILSKGDVRLEITLKMASGDDRGTSIAQILQEQWKAIGVQTSIELMEPASLTKDYVAGDYDVVLGLYAYSNADALHILFASKAEGGSNRLQLNDPAFDSLMRATRTTLDPARQQEAVNAVIRYMMDGAYMINTATPLSYVAVNKRVKGFAFYEKTSMTHLYDAYIPE